MEDLEKLKKILNEPITVNNLNRINDYFCALSIFTYWK